MGGFFIMAKNYTLEEEPGSWTSRRKYIIKEGRKQILKLSDEKEAQAVLNYLNSLNKTKKTKPTKKQDTKAAAKKSIKE